MRIAFYLYCIRSRSSNPEVFFGKDFLKICSKFIGKHPCQSSISKKLLNNFIEIAFQHGCSINLLHIFRTPFPKNSSGGCFSRFYFFYSQGDFDDLDLMWHRQFFKPFNSLSQYCSNMYNHASSIFVTTTYDDRTGEDSGTVVMQFRVRVEMYLEHLRCRTFTMELFCENSYRLKAVNYFYKKAPP